MNIVETTDTSSNRRDQIANFAELLKNAPARLKVFGAIYYGKKQFKSVDEVAKKTGYSNKRVTEIAKPLAKGEKLFLQKREMVNGKKVTVYERIHFVVTNKSKILKLAKNPQKLKGYETKTNPRGNNQRSIRIHLAAPIRSGRVRFVRAEDIGEFAKVKKVKSIGAFTPARLSETAFKAGLVRLLGQTKVPKDWGGEMNDIFSTSVTVRGKKRRAAFALKGPAKSGPLVPKMMGKNGDQIQRLFKSPADLFIVQYEGEIKESIIDLMEQLAKAKSILGSDVYFAVLDDTDSKKLRTAYPKVFK
jgi:hypothetical protein